MSETQTEDKRVEDFQFEKDEDGRFIVPLDFPFSHGKTEYKEIRLRKPKTKDMRKFPAEPAMNDYLLMIGKLAALPHSVIDEIDPKDTGKITEFVAAFF